MHLRVGMPWDGNVGGLLSPYREISGSQGGRGPNIELVQRRVGVS